MTNARHPFLAHPAPLAFAHRGGAADGVENTVAAFARATRLGYTYLETDVHATADGRLVAFHDATLDRVTDGRGRIAALPWSAVRRARVAGREPVPLFEELLEEFPAARWNVDVKAEAALGPLLTLLERTGAWHRVCVGSFDEGRVRRAQALGGHRLATSLGLRGVLGLRLRSYGLPAPVRRSAVCVQVPLRQGPMPVVDARFLRAARRAGVADPRVDGERPGDHADAARTGSRWHHDRPDRTVARGAEGAGGLAGLTAAPAPERRARGGRTVRHR